MRKWEELSKKEKILGLFIVFSVFSMIVSKISPPSKTNNIKQDLTAPSPTPTVSSKTDQEIIEENIESLTKKSSGISFQKLKLEKSITKSEESGIATVELKINDFLNKSSLLNSANNLSSSIFQALFNNSKISLDNILIQYLGETTDRYGNKSTNPVLSYSINKVTFYKMNWNNFNKYKLCDFLNEEDLLDNGVDVGCKILVDIK